MAGMILVGGIAKASPRTDYLREKIKSARTVEIQLETKSKATKRAYNTAKARTSTLERELKRTIKRERAEDEAAREAKIAAYQRVNEYMTGDMTSPVSARLR